LLIWLVAISLIVPSYLAGTRVFGFNVTGWAWVIPLIASLVELTVNSSRKTTFPIVLWAPWLLVLILNLSFRYHQDALQKTLQLLTPLLVAMAASQLRPTAADIQGFLRLMRILFVFFVCSVALHLPHVLKLSLSGNSSMAPHAITSVLFATFFFTLIRNGIPSHGKYMLVSSFIAPATMVRGAIMGLMAVFVTNFSRMRIAIRVTAIIVIGICALAAFSTPFVQRRMFRSGEGTISDMRMENHNFDMGGRQAMWDLLADGIRVSPFVGHGANAHATALRNAKLIIEPHNDWLRISYDYGIPFAAFFPICILLQIRHAYIRAKRSTLYVRVLYLTGISAFVPFALLMLTDNIIVYAQFFGNLQFLILGLAYGADAAERARVPSEQVADRLKSYSTRQPVLHKSSTLP